MKIIKENPKKYKIPFYNGNLLTYIIGYNNEEMVENFVFEDTMYIKNVYRGRSSVTYNLVSLETKKEYPMFVSNLLELIQKCEIKNGIVKAKFEFFKKGRNYGIGLYEEENNG